MQSWPLATARPTGIHDVAPAPDGGVWFTAQRSGHLGWFDPKSGRTELIALGPGSSPHGVIQGPDKAAWITDSGQNAIVRVGWPDRALRRFPLPDGTPYANLNTCAFDGDGDLWFTGQSGVVGKRGAEDRRGHGEGRAARARPLRHLRHAARRGLVVLAGRLVHRAHRPAQRRLDASSSRRRRGQGARRVWSDSRGRIWVSEWNSAATSRCTTRPTKAAGAPGSCPATNPRAYAVYVDERDQVWLSDWGGNAMYRFDPGREAFERFGFPRESANVRQILGRPGEVWLPESGTEHITVIRTS